MLLLRTADYNCKRKAFVNKAKAVIDIKRCPAAAT